jgi:hypothetical protein
LDLEQLALGLHDHVTVGDIVSTLDVVAVEEVVVLVADIVDFVGDGDLLGQARSQGIRPRHDDAVLDAELKEGVAHGANLGEEIRVGHGHLAGLVAALLLVGYLVLDLDRAGARLDHLLRQQVGGLLVAEAGIDVGDDRHDVGLEIVDAVLDGLRRHFVTGVAGRVEFAEQATELTGIRLAQERVKLFDEAGYGGLLVHGLVRQGAELAAQGRDHPAGQVQVALVRVAEVLLDRDQLLLTDEAVPATEGLRVLTRIRVVLGHVPAHDRRRVTGDVEAGSEAVLQAHARRVLRADVFPGVAGAAANVADGADFLLVAHEESPFSGSAADATANAVRMAR